MAKYYFSIKLDLIDKSVHLRKKAIILYLFNTKLIFFSYFEKKTSLSYLLSSIDDIADKMLRSKCHFYVYCSNLRFLEVLFYIFVTHSYIQLIL